MAVDTDKEVDALVWCMTASDPSASDAPASDLLDELAEDRMPISGFSSHPLSVDELCDFVSAFCESYAAEACTVYPSIAGEPLLFMEQVADSSSLPTEGESVMNFWIKTPTVYWYFSCEPVDESAPPPWGWYQLGPILRDSPEAETVQRHLSAQDYPSYRPDVTPETVRDATQTS